MKFTGNFFHIGAGPKDFRSFNIIKKDYPRLWIQDYINKEIKLINVEHGFDDMNYTVEKTYNYKTVTEPLNVFSLHDTCLIIKAYDPAKRLYYLKYNPQQKLSSKEYNLYNYPVDNSLMNKMLVMADEIHPQGNKIVSITSSFNQIDILNMDSPEQNISVTTDKNLVQYQNIVNTDAIQRYYFSMPICNDSLIMVLYNTDKPDNVQIHVIDWDGNPIARLHLDKKITYFNIDFKQKIIYGLHEETEQLYMFSIK